ncbi:hypothetical protein [Butyrivibrio sp. XBB1001]|uniref:hypothetical protein n=1 Tax=Butyrivibrio sp. XBB1001 TaxID=1280682 RepID=UPI00047B046E|nr:hypothetical protein [Butyrivibrio sp. XBB1001]
MSKNNKDGFYTLDFDEHGMLILNRKNAQLINACIAIDSKYAEASNEENKESSCAYIIENQDNLLDLKIMKEICRRLDKENSTHLAASGSKKGDNKGIDQTTETICNIRNLKQRLKDGDAELVTTISEAVRASDGKIRNTFSFASKFCTFLCRYLFEGQEADNYSIYDSALEYVIPYYALVYLNDYDREMVKNKHVIRRTFFDKRNYDGYRKLIDDIREKAHPENEEKLSRKDFDNVLWYYYKGRERTVKNVLQNLR